MTNTVLEIINNNEIEPKDYESRPTVKAVIINGRNEILFFGDSLIGGGVDEGETFLEALSRECLEEVGVSVNVIQELGIVIQYRDYLKRKYEVHGYIARYVETVGAPTTDQEREIGKSIEWKTFYDGIQLLEKKITDLDGAISEEDDSYQGPLYNAKTYLIFLKEAQKILGL